MIKRKDELSGSKDSYWDERRQFYLLFCKVVYRGFLPPRKKINWNFLKKIPRKTFLPKKDGGSG